MALVLVDIVLMLSTGNTNLPEGDMHLLPTLPCCCQWEQWKPFSLVSHGEPCQLITNPQKAPGGLAPLPLLKLSMVPDPWSRAADGAKHKDLPTWVFTKSHASRFRSLTVAVVVRGPHNMPGASFRDTLVGLLWPPRKPSSSRLRLSLC